MTNRSFRITALINTHNYGRFVGEAIESVLAQDILAQPRPGLDAQAEDILARPKSGLNAQAQDFPGPQGPGQDVRSQNALMGERAAEWMEVLVVDDGSTDDTAEVVRRYGERVRYVRKENGGQASALNVGFAEARGEIIATLDGDDLWLPGKARRVLEEFERQPDAGMVYHAMEYWDVQRNTMQKDMHFPAVTGNVPEMRDGLLRYGDVSTSSMAFRKDTVKKLLPIPERLKILADSYLGYLIIFVAPVAAAREHLTRYRVHGGNQFSHSGEDAARLRRRWECWSAAVEEIKSWLARHGWDLQRPDIAAYVRRYELWTWRFRFDLEPPGRKEFFEYLRAHDALYRPLQRPEYRAFRAAMAGAAFVLGYETFEGLRNMYRGAGGAKLREALVPTR